MANRIVTFLTEARSEIGKVAWPRRKTVVKYTIIVIVTCVLTAAFLGLLDLLFGLGLQNII